MRALDVMTSEAITIRECFGDGSGKAAVRARDQRGSGGR
jgi:hypothetical protein